MFSRPSTPTTGRFRSRFSRRKWGAPVVLGGVAGLLLVLFLVSRVFSGGGDYDDMDSEPPAPAKPDTQHDLPSPGSPDHPHYPSYGSGSDDAANSAIDALFARQSTTLVQAAWRYRLKNDRDPPQGYKAWFRFAQENKCLIDDYDQVYRDFAPFYQLAGRKHRDKHGDKYFGAMVEKAAGTIDELDMGLRTFTVRDHEVGTVDEWKSNYDDEWNGMLRNLSKALPNLKLIVNHRDEPRVAFDVRHLGEDDLVLSPNDMMFFRNEPAPTSDFYFHNGHCRISNDPNGQKVRPVLARSIDRRVDLRRELPLVFRLLGLAGPEPRTAHGRRSITVFYEHFCQLEGCDADKIKAEYGITGENAARGRLHPHPFAAPSWPHCCGQDPRSPSHTRASASGGVGRAISYLDTLEVPIIENTPFEVDLKESMAEATSKYPDAAGVFVRRHGSDW
ncbi:CAP10 domain-containing protein [Mycena chlorophos]|uniref:CAP10 domain-containing protein n=1 Tax=Mycena chlorophos TaxID=658473 RepID=A0A8H6TPZ2_MYCCL|nr:CAP10 domain-containing protein [Mycena chlorophos]